MQSYLASGCMQKRRLTCRTHRAHRPDQVMPWCSLGSGKLLDHYQLAIQQRLLGQELQRRGTPGLTRRPFGTLPTIQLQGVQTSLA